MCWKGSTRLSMWWDLEHIENHSKLSTWWDPAQRWSLIENHSKLSTWWDLAQRWSHTDNSFWARNVVRASWNVYQLDAIKMVAHFRRYQMIASIATSDSELLSYVGNFHKQDQRTSYKWFHTPNQSPVRNHQKSNVTQKLWSSYCTHHSVPYSPWFCKEPDAWITTWYNRQDGATLVLSPWWPPLSSNSGWNFESES